MLGDQIVVTDRHRRQIERALADKGHVVRSGLGHIGQYAFAALRLVAHSKFHSTSCRELIGGVNDAESLVDLCAELFADG